MPFASINPTKGPFIYYIITFLGFLDPPPLLRKHVFSTEKNRQKIILVLGFYEFLKGLFIYYVITFLGFLDPPPPPYVIMFLVLKSKIGIF